MAKEILVNNGDRKELKKIFKVSYNTIRTALKFQTKTLLAHQIRQAAIERGGREVEETKN